MKVKNTNPLGEVEVPLLGRSVGAGETIEVTAEEAALLVVQPTNWQAADSEAQELLTGPQEPATGPLQPPPAPAVLTPITDTQEPVAGHTEAADGQEGE